MRRGRWLLVVNLPAVHVPGQERARYPEAQRLVEASGKKAAAALLREWIDELEQASCVDPRRLTIGAMLDRWLNSAGLGLREASLEFYRKAADGHLKPALGQRIASEFKRHDFTAYIAEKRASGLSRTTLSHHKATLRRAYSWAVEEEILDVNPLWHYRNKDAVQQRQKPVDVWDQDTIARAVVMARGTQMHGPAILGGWCGLRPAEVCSLRWSDVLIAKRIVVVQRTVEEVKGRLVEYDTPKSGRVRIVPLTGAAVDDLERLRLWQEGMRKRQVGWNSEGRVVCRRDGEQLTPSGMSSMWAGFVKRRGLPRISPHGLRHSFGTYAFDAYGSKVAQLWLGHQDESTTMIYHHGTSDAMVAAIAAHEVTTSAALAKAETLQNSRPRPEAVVSLDARRAQKTRK